MENIPKKIYLQIGKDFEPNDFTGDFKELSEVTWCADNIFKNDLVYINKQELFDFLQSKRITEKQMKKVGQQYAYGATDIINDVLEFIHRP